jgi:hypothetical protein
MLARIGIVLVALILASFSVSEAADKLKKGSPKAAILKQYDFNKDGKLGRKEQAAALPAIAQMREQRAMRRNARVLQSIQ